MTSPEVTEPEVTYVTEVYACATGSRAFFSYNSSSTKCIIAHDRRGYRRSGDPEWVPLEECAHAPPEIAQYPPQWGLFTENDVIKCHPQGFPWNWKSRDRKGPCGKCSLGRPRPITLSFSTKQPFHWLSAPFPPFYFHWERLQ